MRKSLFFALLFIGSVAYTQQKSNADQLPAKAFQQRMDSLADKQLIDVRTPEEFEAGHLAEAININIYDAAFTQSLKQLNKENAVFVYCKGGSRSAEAAQQLKTMGFKNVYDLQGGIQSWESEGLPVITSDASFRTDEKFTLADFDALLTKNKVLLVDYYAPWCMPCKQMEPALEELSKEYTGKVSFVRINLEQAKPLARKLNIESIPVVAVYKNGTELKRAVGLQSKSNLKMLVKYLLKN